MLKNIIEKMIGSYSEREIKKLKPLLNKTLQLEEEFSHLTDEELKAKTPYFKELISSGKSLDDILPEAFATVREASWRVLGLKHYPVQILGGIAFVQAWKKTNFSLIYVV